MMNLFTTVRISPLCIPGISTLKLPTAIILQQYVIDDINNHHPADDYIPIDKCVNHLITKYGKPFNKLKPRVMRWLLLPHTCLNADYSTGGQSSEQFFGLAGSVQDWEDYCTIIPAVTTWLECKHNTKTEDEVTVELFTKFKQIKSRVGEYSAYKTLLPP